MTRGNRKRDTFALLLVACWLLPSTSLAQEVATTTASSAYADSCDAPWFQPEAFDAQVEAESYVLPPEVRDASRVEITSCSDGSAALFIVHHDTSPEDTRRPVRAKFHEYAVSVSDVPPAARSRFLAIAAVEFLRLHHLTVAEAARSSSEPTPRPEPATDAGLPLHGDQSFEQGGAPAPASEEATPPDAPTPPTSEPAPRAAPRAARSIDVGTELGVRRFMSPRSGARGLSAFLARARFRRDLWIAHLSYAGSRLSVEGNLAQSWRAMLVGMGIRPLSLRAKRFEFWGEGWMEAGFVSVRGRDIGFGDGIRLRRFAYGLFAGTGIAVALGRARLHLSSELGWFRGVIARNLTFPAAGFHGLTVGATLGVSVAL